MLGVVQTTNQSVIECAQDHYQKMTQSWTETPDLMTVQKDPSQLEHEQVHLYLQIEALKCKFIIMLPLRHCGT